MTTPTNQETCACKRCGRDLSGSAGSLSSIEEHQESIKIEFRAGYGSIFGDGNVVKSSLCQHCLQELIGDYLDILEDDPFQPKIKLQRPRGAYQPSQETLLALFLGTDNQE